MPSYSLPLLNGQTQYIVDGKLIPLQFPYLDVLLQGRPLHGTDDFSFRHPQMERGKRAKIFAPFDALDGFSAHIAGKNILYGDRVFPDEKEKEELNRRLSILHSLTFNSRMAKRNRIAVTVTYFVPCTDEHSFACGVRGQYVSVSGIVRKVDMDVTRTISVDQTPILFDDILSITPFREGLFGQDWED